MKIEINDFFLNETFDSLTDELIKSEMKRIIDDGFEYSHPGDVEHYNNLQVAAAYIYNHYTDSGDHYEIEEWPE